jgi:hypothetical protein
MKTLSAHTETAIDNPYVDVIRLLEITIGTKTLYFCDRVFGDDNLCIFNGQLYEPFVLSWGTIKTGRIDPISYATEPGEASFTVDNSQPVGGADSFTALFAANDPQYCAIVISEIHAGATAEADKDDLFLGLIEDITEMTTDRATVMCSGFESSIINKFVHTIVDDTTYPGADPDDIGKMVPQIYGVSLRVPCIAADAGGKTTIAQDMTATSPAAGGTLEVSDASALPSSGAFVFQIDSEQISIASRSGNVLTLISADARGYNDTTAVAHDLGAPGAEIQTSYVYLAADHPVKSIDTVYVDDIRQTTGFTAYTGQTGDAYTGYEGTAVVVFDALPNYLRQVNIEVDSTDLGVDSGGRATGDSGHAHASVQQTIEWYFDDAVVTEVEISGADNICDRNLTNYATFNYDSALRADKITSEEYSGPPQQYRICMRVGTIAAGLTITANFYGLTGWYGATATSVNNNTTRYSPWIDAPSAVNTWAELKAQSMTVTSRGVNTGSIREVWLEVRYTPQASVSGYAAVSLSGANLITGTVTMSGNSTAETVIGERISVDARGFADDATGTYTGVANALLERPNHIRKHILIDRCGQAASIIDAVSDALANDFFQTNSYVLGFPILQRPNVRSLLNRIATQAKSLEFWDAGKHHMVPIRNTESLSKAIDANRIDLGQVWLKYTDRINIKNTLTARYARQWSGHVDETESDRAIVTASNSASITKFGVLQGDSLSFPYVAGETQAQDVLDWRLDDSKGSRLIVEHVGGYFLKAIERGDVVGFNVVDDENLSAALLGLITAKLQGFRVLDKSYRPDGAIQLTAIYAGVAAETVHADNLAFDFSIDNLDLITMDMNFEFKIDNIDLVQHNVMEIQDLNFAFNLDQIRFSGVEYFILKEDFDFILQENGDKIIQESVGTILQENGDAMLQENGDKIFTEI